MAKKKTEKKQSTFYYFYSQGCGFCKKSEPIVDEINKEGKYEILKLDVSDKDNQGLKNELEKEYNKKCGTPWFVDAETGNQVCGYREKDVIKKWLDGEDIPSPPRPTGPPPRVPFMDAPEKDVNKWKEEYGKWVEENSELPNVQKAEDILSRPRPKSDPPRPPVPTATDEDLDKWGEEYGKWKEENGHLPNLQPTEVILQRLKQQRAAMEQQQKAQTDQNTGTAISPDQNARLQRLEQKMDKLIKHLGVK